MKSRRRLIWEIARWEFGRFFKLKQQLIGLVIGVVIGLATIGIGQWVKRSDKKPVKVVVMENVTLALTTPPGSRLNFLPVNGRSVAQLKTEALDKKKIDGILTAKGAGLELIVTKEPIWQDELKQIIAAAQLQQRLAARNVPPEAMGTLFAPPEIALTYHDPDGQANRGARTLAMVFIGLMLYGVFTGNAYLFTGITGEKQNRVTEQVVAAVSPQTWIDGKLLGLLGVALGNLFFTGLLVSGFIIVPQLIRGNFSFALPVVRPELALLLGAAALLGYLFWFAFFAAISATIDDPNNSARSVFLFVPFLPLSLAFAALNNPDTPAMQFLSLLPFTSPTVLPARLLVGNVPAWEIVLSLLLLAGSVWLLRRAAGKIFGMGVLMYGKEPTMREMLRWAWQA
jgi:ABC-2 type transport system permease protein